MDDRTRAGFALNGIRILLLALVLGLIGGFLNLPIWTISTGSFVQQPLSSYLVAGPLFFILERVLYTAVVIGLLAVLLVEAGRRDTTHGFRAWWNRERFAILAAVAAWAIFLGSLSIAINLYLVSVTVAGIVSTVAAGLYLFWTSERVAGGSTRRIALVAFLLGRVSAMVVYGIHPAGLESSSLPIASWPSTFYPVIIAGALLGEVSIALWIGVYSWTMRVTRPAIARAFVEDEA